MTKEQVLVGLQRGVAHNTSHAYDCSIMQNSVGDDSDVCTCYVDQFIRAVNEAVRIIMTLK